ncbi:MAG: hypothetical protein GF346_07240, partial [Candidatus Eisenbacteria bacterium]|nr:hypothetical protein [Candidatus Latescibacterota bacterium]MBD3302225.1 hypothetical protein [Candidatus Eisenbacteria bacterium]
LEATDEGTPDVRLRRFAPDGTPAGAVRTVAAPTSGWRSGVALATDPHGRTLVAWNEESDDGRESDLHARILGTDGEFRSEVFRANRFDEGSQALAPASGARRVALGADGRMAFAWHGDAGTGDESGANVTILRPRDPALLGDLAAGVERIRGRLLALMPERSPKLDANAAPYVPPTFDETRRSPLLDPNALVRDGRDIGFTGFTNTGWRPPDPHMATGIDHVMGIVNGGIAAYEKDGTLLWEDDISGSGGFWGEVGADYFVFDPEVIFDPYENRFMAMANERSDDNRSTFLLGISSTSDPGDPWYKYRLDVTTLAGNDIDSPNLAVDRDAIYLTADFFNPQKYLVYIIDKSSVIDGGVASTTDVLHTGTQSFGIPVMYTDDAPNMYMIEHFESDPSSSVRLWAIEDPLTSPSLVSTTLNVDPYYRPADLRSQGTGIRQAAFDSRFWSCMYRDGSLWACHHISLSNSPRVTVSRWYEIEMNGWPESGNPPTLRQQGTVAPPNEVFCSFNSITVNEHGDAVMVFARSSVNEYFSISRTVRYSGDPLGTMRPPEFVKQSDAVYGQNRWGDYSAIVVDPVDSRTFWMHHEYAPSTNNWHTWIQGEQVIDPAAVGDPVEALAATLRVTPSPTTGPATVRFSLAREQEVVVSIFDVAGRRVRQVEPGQLGAREHQIRWDGRDDAGRPAANGVYLVRLTGADGSLLGSERIVVAR